MSRQVIIIMLALLTISLGLAPACAGSNAAPTPEASPAAAVASPTASTAPPPEPSPTAAPSLLVGNTGGLGVFIRRTPAGDQIRAWPDGATMTVIGEDKQAEGRTWKNVRDPDGNNGWVAAEYLVVP